MSHFKAVCVVKHDGVMKASKKEEHGMVVWEKLLYQLAWT